MTRVPTTAKARLTSHPAPTSGTITPITTAFLGWVSRQPRLAVLLVIATVAWMGVALLGAGLIAIVT